MRQREPGETEPDAYDHLEARAACAAMEAFVNTFVEAATSLGLPDALKRLGGSRHEHLSLLCLDDERAMAVRLTVHFDDSSVAVERMLNQARARGDLS